MIFETWLVNAAPGLGISAGQLGTMLAFLFIAAFDVVVSIATQGRDKGMGVMIGTVIGLILFTFMGWIPGWTGAILAILGTILFVETIRNRL